MDASVYLDHAATTPVAPDVLEAMLPYLRDEYGNPSSIYALARGARRALDQARDAVAEVLGGRAGEIVFTSGGTESVNLAVKGVAWANRARGTHLVTTRVEHLAVINACEYLEKHGGFRVTYVDVDRFGRVDPEAVLAAVTPETTLVSVQLANNEVGTLQPVQEIAERLRGAGHRAVLHTDACQAAGALSIDVDGLGVDMLSLSAHKFYGPKGAGALYARRGTLYHPQAHGGSNERGRRAGAENVAGIVGLATALRMAYADLDANNAYVGELRDRLVEGVLGRTTGVHPTGHPTERLPSFASFVFERIEGESLLLGLDARGVFASSGAACTSGTLDPSHVMTAIGLPADLAHGSLRLTTGLTNTPEQITYAVDQLAQVVDKLRALAPTAR
ncbi:MAG TPA: cysteine desulfurase family protein [Chloroflexota bacterium]|nr:cysteine desulfurase family protein [Chloroflexota bacterium]